MVALNPIISIIILDWKRTDENVNDINDNQKKIGVAQTK